MKTKNAKSIGNANLNAFCPIIGFSNPFNPSIKFSVTACALLGTNCGLPMETLIKIIKSIDTIQVVRIEFVIGKLKKSTKV